MKTNYIKNNIYIYKYKHIYIYIHIHTYIKRNIYKKQKKIFI